MATAYYKTARLDFEPLATGGEYALYGTRRFELHPYSYQMYGRVISRVAVSIQVAATRQEIYDTNYYTMREAREYCARMAYGSENA